MLKLGDLALRPDLHLGPMLVSPSRRLVEGPDGRANLQPLIMQIFLLLLDARGKVVTRTELFDQCWGGVMVGDDSINQAIAKLRRTGANVAPGLVEIETIPRTGYRLTGPIVEFANCQSATSSEPPVLSRRLLIGGVAAAAAVGTTGFWLTADDQTDPRFDRLIQRGEEALRIDDPRAREYFEQAAATEPRNARAWGLLAYALGSGADDGPRAVQAQAAQAAERAAQTALEIDPNEVNARLAVTLLQNDMLDWFTREERYRHILASDPDNTLVMRHLGQMLHGVGRCREALAVAERALAIHPLSPAQQLRKALRLWVLGRIPEADRVINRAMELWPSHRLVRMARLMIYAFTDRPRAALAIVEDEEANPTFLSPAAASVWRATLAALEEPTPSQIAAARKANVEGSHATPAIAAWAILALSALGEVDAAFEVASGFLLGRGSLIVRPRPESGTPRVNAPGWRNTFGLFTPPTLAMRLDPRFGPLAEGLGLTGYWRKRGTGPDAFLFRA